MNGEKSFLYAARTPALLFILFFALSIMGCGDTKDENPFFQGSGNNRLTVDWPEDEPFLLHINAYQEDGRFSVTGFEERRYRSKRFADATGPFEGVSFCKGGTVLLEIDATGSWEIEIRPLTDAVVRKSPGETMGTGYDVFLVEGSPVVVEVESFNDGEPFEVRTYKMPLNGSELLADTVGPFTGRTRVSPGVGLVEVRAVGDWRISLEE